MGAGQSKEELLYQEVQNGNQNAVKALRQQGASLEWVDKEGRTPLLLACTRGELLDMVATLLQLGANIMAYRPGTNGGFPLHHAAKRGLEKTVKLLLHYGADPLAINDDGHTPLEMARNKGHLAVVRLLEDQLGLFNGMLRELSGLGILETFMPNLVTKKIWAVVLPTEVNPRRVQKYELVIYQSPKAAQPRTTISLANVDVEEPKFNLPDPVLYITDKTSKTKYKFLSENEGDKAQLERLYRACKGIVQVRGVESMLPLSPSSPSLDPPGRGPNSLSPSTTIPNSNVVPPPSLPDDDVALALALDLSIRTATEEGIPVSPPYRPPDRNSDYNGWGHAPNESHGGWGPPTNGQHPSQKTNNEYGGWEEGNITAYKGWGGEGGVSISDPSPGGSQPSQNASSSLSLSPLIDPSPPLTPPPFVASSLPPSAPPLPHYPTFDDVPASEEGSLALPNGTRVDGKSGPVCVVCWDAPAEGVCVPCGHLAGCMGCLTEIKSKNWGCPVCRSSIDQLVKVYNV